MQLGIESQIPDGLLAANALLAENSRQGVPTSTHTLHRGFEFAISSTALSLEFRCSESASGTVDAPSKGNCTAQRIVSGITGAANLGVAAAKIPDLIGTVVALGATGEGAPAAAVLGVYGTTSIFGQGLAGAAQLYSAFTGNYGAPAQVAQIGNILSGPVSGLGTLLAGGSLATAERNAGYESMFTAGSGLINALAGEASALPLAMADHNTAFFGAFAPSSGCTAGHS
jgi:hypothetical protein